MYRKFLKRLFDLVFSICGLIILFPVMVIIFIGVKINLGNPVIFKQKRPGLNGKIFTLYKFKTMNNKKDEYGNLLDDDKRVTKFGNFLRRTSLDELPELINIIKGDMSIVGPRPLLIEYLGFYTQEEYKRHLVKPGLTGLAQIHGRNLLNWEDRFKLDVQYVQNISFILDFKIILKTIVKVLRKEDVVIRQENKMKDLNVQRSINYEIKKVRMEDLLLNEIKIKNSLNELLRTINYLNSEEVNKIYTNMINYTKDKTAIIVGAFYENDLIGFIWGYKKGNSIHINYFFVDEKYRKNGIGSKLINEIYKIAKENNIKTLELNVGFNNKMAQNFYNKQGFKFERIFLCKIMK